MDTLDELCKALDRYQMSWEAYLCVDLHVIGGTALVGSVDIMVARLGYGND